MKILNQTYNLLCKLQIKSPSYTLKRYYTEFRNVLSPVVYFSCFSPLRCMTINSSNSSTNILRNGGKCFQETENEYAHKVMENLPNYSSSLLMHPLLLNKHCVGIELSENSSAVQTFIKITINNISQGLCLESEKFKDMILNVCSSLSQASDEEIKMVLHCLCLWPPTSSTKTPNFCVLWNTLDRECVNRIKHWDVSHQLLIADYWFHLRLSRICAYNQEVIFNLISTVDSLSNHHLVQLMFYINLQRKIPPSFMSNLEKKLESVVHCLTVEELGIICLGFFKTQNKMIDTKLIQTVVKKFMYNVENVDTVTVAAVLKFLRKSLNRSFIDLYILLLHKCVSCIDNWDIPTSVHLALLSSECNVYHPLLLNSVSEKVADKITDARIKDCAKLLNIFLKKFSNMSCEKKHLVFVYGTLKRGEPNHDLIEQRTKGFATFVGNAKTVKLWPLVIASRYNIPYLLYCEGKGEHVCGEIYELDDVMLAKFDELENHPDYYTRLVEEVLMVTESGEKILKPWIYFLKNFRSELLSLPFLSDYSSKGSHGLEYVSSEETSNLEDIYS